MIYLIGGAPRAGKTILGQQLSAKLRIGWISTDLLQHVLQDNKHDGPKPKWDAAPQAIIAFRSIPRALAWLHLFAGGDAAPNRR